jgi:hypothetical protein
MGIILNSDGVALGNTNQQACTVMGTIANFSPKLMQSGDSKICLGYIPKLTINKNRLLRHLMDVCKLPKTRAKASIKIFEREVDKKMWDLILEPIVKANKDGIYLKLLNTPYKKAILVYPYLLHHVGDEPGQKRVCGMFEANAKCFCLRCLYTFDCNPGFPGKKMYRSRNFENVKRLCTISQRMIFKDPKEVTVAELQSALQLQKIGIHPGIHPFMTCPRGFSSNNMFTIPYDLMHTWPGGVMKTLAFQICVIIFASNGNLALFDGRLSAFPRMPESLPHVPITTFPKGYIFIIMF